MAFYKLACNHYTGCRLYTLLGAVPKNGVSATPFLHLHATESSH